MVWISVNLTNEENNKNNENFYKASKDKQYKLNMIELLSNLSIPLSIIIYAIKKVVSFHYEKNKDSYVKEKKNVYNILWLLLEFLKVCILYKRNFI